MDQQPDINSTNTEPAQNNAPSGFTQRTLGQPDPKPFAAALPGQPKGLKGFYRENRFYVWAIVVGVVIIAVLSFFAFRKKPAVAPQQANVVISTDVPQSVPAGSEAVYKIKVDNQDSQKLIGMSLEVAYPEGMTFISSSPNPDNLSGTVFKVPDLVPGQNATVFLKAQVSGNVNDTKDLLIKLHYKYSNFNSEFIKQETATVRLTASDVSLDLTGPSAINNAQPASYTLKYQNNSESAIGNARIVLHYPDGFAYASAQPQPNSGNNLWNLNSLAPGDSGTITFSGSFASANPGESKNITAELLILGQDGQYFTQNTADFTTTLATLPLLVSQSLEERYAKGVIDPGDSLTMTVKYQNNGSVVANGVNVLVTLNSKVLDMSTLQAEGGQVTGNTILWNGSTVTNLQNLNPSDSGTLTFSVQVKNPATRDSSKNLTIVSDVKIKSNEYDSYFPGNQVNLKVSSPIVLRPALAYQSGSQPPQVGKETLYAVNLQLTNSSNDITSGTLTAFLPLGAGGFVAGSVNAEEASKVQFDSSTGKLTWQVGPLPANTGKFSTPRTLQFGVRIIPSASQGGTSPTLVKDIQFMGTDSFTAQSVTAKADNLTTRDTGDNANGTVVK